MSELDDLSKKIAAAKKIRHMSPENMNSADPISEQEMNSAMRVGIELFAGVLVGLVIGFFLDKVFHTLPLFLIIFIMIGAAAGLWNTYKNYTDFTNNVCFILFALYRRSWLSLLRIVT